jgi:hypothetical protein
MDFPNISDIVIAYSKLALVKLGGRATPIAQNRYAICISNTCGIYDDKTDKCKNCGCSCQALAYSQKKPCPKNLWR